MGNLGWAWAYAAQAGTLAVLIAGCEAEPASQDAGARPAEDAGLPACGEPKRVDFAACVRFEDQASEQTSLTGVVEAIEQPERVCPGLLHDSVRTLSLEQSFALTIRDGDVTATVQIHLPWKTPLVAIGDTVSLEHFITPGGVESPATASSSMRDEHGELLYWFLSAGYGFDEFEPPRELSVQNGPRTCMTGSNCPDVRRDLIAESSDSGEITIEVGEMADVGDYVVLHGENTVGMCDFATDPYFHTVTLAAVRGSKASLDARDAAE